MKDYFIGIALNDEIRIGYKSIKKGLAEFSKITFTSSEPFIPFLLLSVGFERILKLLYCFDYYQKNNQQYPKSSDLKNNLRHYLNKQNQNLINICKNYPHYAIASDRIKDIEFLKSNDDFRQVLDILDSFSNGGRYFNLDLITENPKIMKKPEELLSTFRKQYIKRFPEIIENCLKPNFDNRIIYEKFNSHFIELVQRFTRILSFAFTQGAFGSIARQYSAGISEFDYFLRLKDNDLSKIF